MARKKSVCCGADYRAETWVSKTIRRIYFCLECGEPCRIRSATDQEKSEPGGQGRFNFPG